MASDTKRVHDRISFSSPVRISKPTPQDGTGIDLGVGGVAVRVATAVSEGSTVEVVFSGDGAAVPGTVRRSAPHPDGGFRLGIEWHAQNEPLLAKMAERMK